MATITIHSPVPGYEGTVAGAEFYDGRATVDRSDLQALAYFRRHGYGFDEPASIRPESPDPRKVGTDGDGVEVVGSRLRDAAVDPALGDFLPPTNAGGANPHGPTVVSPGLHATPPAPIVPGPVSSDARRQERVETAAAEAALVDQRPVSEVTAESAAEQPPAVVDGAAAEGTEGDRPSTKARAATKKAHTTRAGR